MLTARLGGICFPIMTQTYGADQSAPILAKLAKKLRARSSASVRSLRVLTSVQPRRAHKSTDCPKKVQETLLPELRISSRTLIWQDGCLKEP